MLIYNHSNDEFDISGTLKPEIEKEWNTQILRRCVLKLRLATIKKEIRIYLALNRIV